MRTFLVSMRLSAVQTESARDRVFSYHYLSASERRSLQAKEALGHSALRLFSYNGQKVRAEQSL